MRICNWRSKEWNAIDQICYNEYPGNRNDQEKVRDEISKLLHEMGLDTMSISQFDDVPFHKQQYARALWLIFAAMYARELDI